MLGNAGFAETPRLVQAIEEDKGAIGYSGDRKTFGRQRNRGFEILEKDGTLARRDERSPVRRRARLVVNLELTKTAGVIWNRIRNHRFFLLILQSAF